MIDGEHYAPVVRDALAELPYEIVGCVLVGGTEKLRGGEGYGVPLHASIEEAIAVCAPDVVLDLSDEPVLGPPARCRLAARALLLGVPYEGADFRFDPPRFEPIGTPSVAVIGTGKRVGKTAVTGHVARALARERKVVVVAMGRGGPPEPELVEIRPTVEDLLRISRAGRHAASDHLETAALVGASDDRLPSLRRRSRGRGRHVERARRRPARREPRSRPDRSRRERRGAPTDRRRAPRFSSWARTRRPPSSRAISIRIGHFSPTSSSSRWPRTASGTARSLRR